MIPIQFSKKCNLDPAFQNIALSAWQTTRSHLTTTGDFSRLHSGFYEAPSQETLSGLHESTSLAREMRNSFPNASVLVLGIGGSALGAKSITQALGKTRAIYFLESPDPVFFNQTLSELDPAQTLVVVISKSGNTFETLALFYAIYDWLGAKRAQKQMTIITDPARGELREAAQILQLKALPVPPSVGGRFSVFTPVGLFPMLLSGISAHDFLKGARTVREALESSSSQEPFFALAGKLFELRHTKPIHVLMTYSTMLQGFNQWWVQLWAESLGKNHSGFTPLAAQGPTDQHSLLQLLVEGPQDKFVTFCTVGQVDSPVPIPKAPTPSTLNLSGQTLASLTHIEFEATRNALEDVGCLSATLTLPSLTAFHLGELHFTYTCLTALMGTLLGINAYDQNGVENTKLHIRRLLSPEKNLNL